MKVRWVWIMTPDHPETFQQTHEPSIAARIVWVFLSRGPVYCAHRAWLYCVAPYSSSIIVSYNLLICSQIATALPWLALFTLPFLALSSTTKLTRAQPRTNIGLLRDGWTTQPFPTRRFGRLAAFLIDEKGEKVQRLTLLTPKRLIVGPWPSNGYKMFAIYITPACSWELCFL